MAYSHDYTIGRLSEEINRMYALNHGYEFSVDSFTYMDMLSIISPREHTAWYKVKAINDRIRREDSRLGKDVEYIVWIDADAVVINAAIRLEDIVIRGEYKDLIIAEDMTPACSINTGVVLIRINEWSKGGKNIY